MLARVSAAVLPPHVQQMRPGQALRVQRLLAQQVLVQARQMPRVPVLRAQARVRVLMQALALQMQPALRALAQPEAVSPVQV